MDLKVEGIGSRLSKLESYVGLWIVGLWDWIVDHKILLFKGKKRSKKHIGTDFVCLKRQLYEIFLLFGQFLLPVSLCDSKNKQLVK